MKLQEIIETLHLKSLTDVEEKDVSGVFISDMLSDVMSSAKADHLWLTVQTHKSIVAPANLIGIAAIVITHGKNIPQDTIDLANRFHVVILSASVSTFELASKLAGMDLES